MVVLRRPLTVPVNAVGRLRPRGWNDFARLVAELELEPGGLDPCGTVSFSSFLPYVFAHILSAILNTFWALFPCGTPLSSLNSRVASWGTSLPPSSELTCCVILLWLPDLFLHLVTYILNYLHNDTIFIHIFYVLSSQSMKSASVALLFIIVFPEISPWMGIV